MSQDEPDALELTRSSGNVFADLGLPDAELLLAKTDLAIAITAILDRRGLKQAAAAELMGIDQPKVSAITRGRLDDFSLERLMLLAARLGQDIEIRLTPNPEPRRQARLVVQSEPSDATPQALAIFPARAEAAAAANP